MDYINSSVERKSYKSIEISEEGLELIEFYILIVPILKENSILTMKLRLTRMDMLYKMVLKERSFGTVEKMLRVKFVIFVGMKRNGEKI